METPLHHTPSVLIFFEHIYDHAAQRIVIELCTCVWEDGL